MGDLLAEPSGNFVLDKIIIVVVKEKLNRNE